MDLEFHIKLGDKFDYFMMAFRSKVVAPINDYMLKNKIDLFLLNASLRRVLGVLLKINDGNGCLISDLAIYAHLDRSHATKAIIELEQLGFVERYKKENDYKRVYVRMLPKGKLCTQTGDDEWSKTQKDYFEKCLKPEQLEELDKGIDKIVEILGKLEPKRFALREDSAINKQAQD